MPTVNCTRAQQESCRLAVPHSDVGHKSRPVVGRRELGFISSPQKLAFAFPCNFWVQEARLRRGCREINLSSGRFSAPTTHCLDIRSGRERRAFFLGRELGRGRGRRETQTDGDLAAPLGFWESLAGTGPAQRVKKCAVEEPARGTCSAGGGVARVAPGARVLGSSTGGGHCWAALELRRWWSACARRDWRCRLE